MCVQFETMQCVQSSHPAIHFAVSTATFCGVHRLCFAVSTACCGVHRLMFLFALSLSKSSFKCSYHVARALSLALTQAHVVPLAHARA